MEALINPQPLAGEIPAIASKSMAHRLLICAAFADHTTDITCDTTSADIDATARCLNALGARITRTRVGFRVRPRREATSLIAAQTPTLDCGESGSTLRFILPVVCALGVEADLIGAGRLASRPLSPLYEELIAAGANLSEQGSFPLHVSGRIRPGRFQLPGNVSSQYLSGLLLAAPLLGEKTEIVVKEPLESRPYVTLTIRALESFGVSVTETSTTTEEGTFSIFTVPAHSPYVTPGQVSVEGDWSNAAFWLAAGCLAGPGVSVTKLDLASPQGDRTILAALALLGARLSRRGSQATAAPDTLNACSIDVSDCPDLVPPLAAVACFAQGTTHITGAERLRLKESDRLETVTAALNALGGNVRIENDGLIIEGVDSLNGGTVDAANDHRIAMMAAIAAIRATSPVRILDAGCVAKSYPDFFKDYATLGGNVTLS